VPTAACRCGAVPALSWCGEVSRGKHIIIISPAPGPYVAQRKGAFTRYSFTSRLWCTNQPSFHPPRPFALPTACCSISARLLDSRRLPFQPPVCMLYTIQYWSYMQSPKRKGAGKKLQLLLHNQTVLMTSHDFGAVTHNERRYQFRLIQSCVPNCSGFTGRSWIHRGFIAVRT